MLIEIKKDPIGSALLDYYQQGEDVAITVNLDIADEDTLMPSYFFRAYDAFPELEKEAMRQTRGRVLDVGAGAGSHSLYLQGKGVDVTALDVSPKSVDVMTARGLDNVKLVDFFEFKEGSFDTILFLMNGIGLVRNLDGFKQFFKQVSSLLAPNGQVILDSSDLIYMFEEEDGSYLIDMNEAYHGEVEFNLTYKDIKGEPFNWLYISEELLQDAAEENGFSCDIIQQGDHYDYLAKLSLKTS